MIPINYTLTVTGIAAGVPRSTRGKMMKSAFDQTAGLWHKEIRPVKFTERGARVYHYERRTHAYKRTKRKRFGHNNPLEFSGDSRERTKVRDIRSTSKRSRIVARARTFNFRPSGHRRTMAEEYKAVTKADAKTLAKKFKDVMARLLRAYKRTRTRRF